MKNNLQIAIDGPVGSGKGTLAVSLAKRLNALHISTGGMYRALALACLRTHTDINNSEEVLRVLMQIKIDMVVNGNTEPRIILDGEDVTEEIFYPEVSNITPTVAAYKEVREEMVRRQKEIADGKSVVMEGRDTTTVVLPNADIKVYLTADIDVRTQRRLNQLKNKKMDIEFEKVKADIQERDRADSERSESPMLQAPDALIVDTSHDTIDETVEKVILELNKRNLYD